MGRDGELLSVAAAAQSYRTLVQTLFTSSRKKDKKKQLKKKEKENLLLPSSTLEGILTSIYCYFGGIPGSSDGKESICSVRDLDLIPGLGRSPGEGKGYPLQILVWRIPWTVPSTGLQRVRHDLSDFHFHLPH